MLRMSVLDGTDAVMLSAETASGQYPLEAIAAMDRVCIEAENEQALQMMPTADVRRFTKIDESIAMAASYVAEHLPIKAVVALSQSGASVLWLSRSNIIAPIYALSPYSETRQRLKLYRGVHNFALTQESIDTRESWVIAEETLLQKGILIEGDLILMMTCEHTGKAVNTNTLRAMVVGKT